MNDIADISRQSAKIHLHHNRVNSKHSKLKRIILIHEDGNSWVKSAVECGFSLANAEIASNWLLGFKEIVQIWKDLSHAAVEHGVTVELVELQDFVRNLGSYVASASSECDSILWNVTDGQASFKGSLVVSLATLVGVPFFGCPLFAQALGQDKFKLYTLCRAIGVPVPASALIEGDHIVCSFLGASTAGPYFVKPNSMGNKVGLTAQSICPDMGGALEQAKSIGKEFHDRAVIQSFIDGPEIRLTFIDADSECGAPKFGYDLVDENEDGLFFISFSQRDVKYSNFRDFLSSPRAAQYGGEAVTRRIRKSVSLIARHCRLKDYFTFDFRIDRTGVPHLIDFNPGAFLYGHDVEGYAQFAYNLPLSKVLFKALDRAFSNPMSSLDNDSHYIFRL